MQVVAFSSYMFYRFKVPIGYKVLSKIILTAYFLIVKAAAT